MRLGKGAELRKGKTMLLGIDIGTTNVKVVVVDESTLCVRGKVTQCLGELEKVDDVPGAAERSVSQIFRVLEECMEGLDTHLLAHVRGIGVCGQMHGCILWNSDHACLFNGALCADIASQVSSNLFTWQDTRCDPSFLSSLPKLSHLANKPPPVISAGYGCATLAWLQCHDSKTLSDYDRAGTIMDMVVCALCSGGVADVVMSSHNAESWGYFNQSSLQWQIEILEDHIPLDLLPTVVNVPSTAGHLMEEWHNVPRGTKVFVAMGDLQCSVYAAQPSLSDAVLNMGSASQFSLIKPNNPLKPPPPIPQSVDELPYFDGNRLLVAAALGGGKTISLFISTLQGWLAELGLEQEALNFHDAYEKLMEAALDKLETTLEVDSRVWGERHAPEARGAVSNVGPDNVSVGDMGSAMVRGVVENLRAMLTPNLLKHYQVERVLGTGSTLQKHRVFREHIQHVFKIPLALKNEADGPLGAAMAIKNYI